MKTVILRNETRDAALARVECRDTMLGRARGLLGRAGLREGDGIMIRPCSSVHMFFMRFPIDVLYLDRDNRVAKCVTNLRPFRVSVGGRGAHSAVELPVGTIERSGTRPGDLIAITDAG